MKGLFLHEIYSMKRVIKFYALLWVVYFFIGIFVKDKTETVTTFLMMFLPLMLVINSFSYHNASKWDVYANMLPVTKKQLVGVYYLLAAVGIFISALSSILVIAVKCGFQALQIVENSSLIPYSFAPLYYNFVVMAVLFAIVIPLMIRFGLEKVRTFLIILIFMFYGCLFGLKDEILKMTGVFDFHMFWTFSPLLVVTAFVLSFWLSLHFYEKKEF